MADERRGSAVSDKNIRLAVQNGWLVEASTPGERIRGYICGLDDYHLAIVPREDPEQIILLGKGNVMLRIYRNELLENETEEFQRQIAGALTPFRQKLERENRPRSR